MKKEEYKIILDANQLLCVECSLKMFIGKTGDKSMRDLADSVHESIVVQKTVRDKKIDKSKKAYREKRMRYYQKNKKSIAARKKLYYQANKEVIGIIIKEYYHANKEAISLKWKKSYAARKKKEMGDQ